MSDSNELQRLRDEKEAEKTAWREDTTATLKEVGKTLAEMNVILHTTARQSEATSHVLQGNNPPATGIPYRVAKLEEAHIEHRREHDERRKWLWGIAATAVGGALTAIYGAMKKL